MLKKLNPRFLTTFAIILISISVVLFLLIFAMPFLPLSTARKGIYITALFIGGEITWWAGVALVGKQLISKYSKQLNPANWFRGKKDLPGNS
jgi:hypothetical protein